MSDEIRSGDVFAPDVFTKAIEDAKLLEATLAGVSDALKASLNAQKSILSGTKIDGAANIEKINEASKDSLKIQIDLAKVEKAQLDVQTKRIKLQQLEEKEKKKAIDSTTNIIKQQRELAKQLASMQRDNDPAGYDKIAKQAGKLKDQINDAKEAVKVFSKESKASQAKTLFSQIASDIGDLDFASAADKAKQFAAVMKSITFAEVIGGIKAFGSAIADVGKAMVLNPFLMVAAGIAAIGLAIKETYDSFVQYNEIVSQSNERLKEADRINKDLVKSIEDLTLKNKVLNKEMTQGQADRARIDNEFKDKFISNRQDERAELDAVSKKFAEANEMTITEQALGEAGKALYYKRMETAYAEQLQQTVKIREKYASIEANLKKEHQLKITVKDKEEQTKEEKKEEVARKKTTEKKIKEGVLEIEKKASLQNQIRQSEIDLIQDERERQIAQIKFNRDIKIKEIEETAATEKEKAELIYNIRKKAIDDLNKLENEGTKKLTGILDDSGVDEKADRDRKKEEQKKRIKEEADFIIDTYKQALDAKNKLIDEENDREIEKRKSNIEQQQELAAKGLDNQWAFEKAQLAKAELAKEQQRQKEIRQEKQLAFFKLVGDYASSGDKDAVMKAFVQMGIASVIQGSYIDGTENVARDLGANKVHSGRDGYFIAVDGEERILNPEQNAKVGQMSNDELANLAMMYNSGYIPKIVTAQDVNSGFAQNVVNSAMLHQFAAMNNEIKELKQVIKERPTSEIKMDNLGNVINKKITKGFIVERKHKPGQSPLNYI